MIRPTTHILLAPLAALLMAAAPRPQLPPSPWLLAAGSCAHADAVAKQQGGEVIGSPKLVTQNGKQVCVMTILIRKDNSPPVRRKVTFDPR